MREDPVVTDLVTAARNGDKQAWDALQLIALLAENPPVPDAEISARLGIPIGSIGANRGRCLDKLRDHPAIAALINALLTDGGFAVTGVCRTASSVLAGRIEQHADDRGSLARLSPGSRRLVRASGWEAEWLRCG